VTFFALAAYLAAEGIRDLTNQARPEHSIPGIAVTTAALIIMPGLAIAKRRTRRRMPSRAVLADSARDRLVCRHLCCRPPGCRAERRARVVWADPAAALVIAALALREGFDAWENDDN
jgi:divalent metal cation (Fe/Co/Zn/Cd) transporter